MLWIEYDASDGLAIDEILQEIYKLTAPHPVCACDRGTSFVKVKDVYAVERNAETSSEMSWEDVSVVSSEFTDVGLASAQENTSPFGLEN